jgi:hypothetical protein
MPASLWSMQKREELQSWARSHKIAGGAGSCVANCHSLSCNVQPDLQVSQPGLTLASMELGDTMSLVVIHDSDTLEIECRKGKSGFPKSDLPRPYLQEI